MLSSVSTIRAGMGRVGTDAEPKRDHYTGRERRAACLTLSAGTSIYPSWVYPLWTVEAPMTPAAYHILLSLVDQPSHGYAIMQEIEDRTGGTVKLGPATLYRSLERLLREGLIEEHVSGPGANRRREYSMTPTGRVELQAEAERLFEFAAQAMKKGILPA